MIQITPHMRIMLGVEAVDFCKGIDGLARVCREVLKADPFSGYVFVFRNKRATAIKQNKGVRPTHLTNSRSLVGLEAGKLGGLNRFKWGRRKKIKGLYD